MDKAKFIMLIGLPASGKTEYAGVLKEKNKNSVIVSSDEIRKELFGDESVQKDHDKVFAEMQKRTLQSLKESKSVIYDATNISRGHRKHLLSLIPDGVEKHAIVVWSKYESCVQRDASRERKVGESVIRRMIRRFQPPYYDEGWDRIGVYHTDDLYTEHDYNDWMNCDHDNPHHNNTVMEHTQKACMCAFEKANNALEQDMLSSAFIGAVILLAAAMHDTGKKFTKSFTNSKGEVSDIAHYYDHQNVGSYYSLGFSRLANNSTIDVITVAWLVNVHMEPFFNSKYYNSLSPENKWMVDVLHSCDIEGA